MGSGLLLGKRGRLIGAMTQLIGRRLVLLITIKLLKVVPPIPSTHFECLCTNHVQCVGKGGGASRLRD